MDTNGHNASANANGSEKFLRNPIFNAPCLGPFRSVSDHDSRLLIPRYGNLQRTGIGYKSEMLGRQPGYTVIRMDENTESDIVDVSENVNIFFR